MSRQVVIGSALEMIQSARISSSSSVITPSARPLSVVMRLTPQLNRTSPPSSSNVEMKAFESACERPFGKGWPLPNVGRQSTGKVQERDFGRRHAKVSPVL